MSMTHEQTTHTAYVGLGSNIGSRHETLNSAVTALDDSPDVSVTRVSTFIETEPVGGPSGQRPYLNGAVEIRTSLTPTELLRRCQAIENDHGRTRDVRWGPRTLDLDILLYDDATVDTDELIVPHPRMHERRFVLEPLCEIAPNVRHPRLGACVRDLLDRLS